MTISIWRYSHLALAVSSVIFIFLASVTGIILAFLPISEQLKPYKADNFKQITLSKTLGVLKQSYDEVLDLQIDNNGFVLINAINKEGKTVNGYVDPNTGKYLGERLETPKFFQWITNFHRSLFLKSIGRFFVGLCSFFLFLIALSGTVLIIKRQRSLKRFFSKIINENFNQYWHVVLGRLSLIPIIIITLTGVYLSLEKFNLLPETKQQHQIDFDALSETPKIEISEFPLLKTILLKEVRSVEFPFSSDIEDYYTIKLKDKELAVNQFTGTVLSELNTPKTVVFSVLSLNLHTGKGSILWSIILAIATANILFFIYSGFAMTFKRRATKLRNKYTAKTAETIILVGSENGSTIRYAHAFHKQLLNTNCKSFIDQLNNYKQYPKATRLVVITATYGQGDPPTNAIHFLKKLEEIKQPNILQFSVIGFGSLAYPDFCKYAYTVDRALSEKPDFSRLLTIETVNDRAFESFSKWADQWATSHHLKIELPIATLTSKPKRLKPFKVLNRTVVLENIDKTFSVWLKPQGIQRFTSGDLLAIYPNNDYKERLYSIGKVNNTLHLSIKLHDYGLGSNFLNDLQKGATIKSKIVRNEAFYFPKKASKVILIANGTGIAPFLGMINQNNRKIETHLYWGVRKEQSATLYKPQLETDINQGRLTKLSLALSQEGQKAYVQDFLKADSLLILETLKTKGVIMICGSLSMQNDVLGLLEHICSTHHNRPLTYYIDNKQIKTDCY
ncbi:MAG: PepSY domain-containing protein [Aestuariibaculum sp.]